MNPLLVALLAGVGFIVAYYTYGRWLGRRIFALSAQAVCPSVRLNDGNDYVPTPKTVVFGHHFTSIAGTGPIVGPAIAIMWGWLPALLWVIFGSIFIGAVHDLGALVVSLRNNGQTVGDIAGRLINRRVRLLFLLVLFMALTIVLAIFGMVIAAVFRQYPAAIFPCMVQIPIAVVIGVWLHARGKSLLIPSLLALAVMYLTVIYGDVGFLHTINMAMAGWSNIAWVIVLLVYSYVASVLPVWMLLQPRDYINSLQLISALALIVVGLVIAATMGGAPPVAGAERPPLQFVAPMIDLNPAGAPMIFPFLFITIACGAISGFHCLVSSGTSSKQLKSEPEARFVGYGGMLTEGFLATLVILACAAGIGLGLPGTAMVSVTNEFDPSKGTTTSFAPGGIGGFEYRLGQNTGWNVPDLVLGPDRGGSGPRILRWNSESALIGESAWAAQYPSWAQADKGLGTKVGAFVVGSANFCNTLGIPMPICIALMGVLVASFAGTTLDTACRLQRYVIQELAATLLPPRLVAATEGQHPPASASGDAAAARHAITLNPLTWLTNMHGATLFAVGTAMVMAAIPLPGKDWSVANAGAGGMILWPLFGATNQLLGGLAFMVIAFYLWRRGKPVWFILLPTILMLIMPAWAMVIDLPKWWESGRYVLAGIALATLALEVWMVVEAALLFPAVRNVLESNAQDLPVVARRGFEVVPAVRGAVEADGRE
jgi:carbon starvation protein